MSVNSPWGCFKNGLPASGGGGTPFTPTNLAFYAERSTNQTIGGGATVIIDTDLVIRENPVGTFDLVNNRFTCTVPGNYVFCLSVDMQFGGFSAYGVCALRVNGTTRTDEQAEADIDDYIRMGNSFIWPKLEVGDYVDAIVFNSDIFSATLVGCQNQFSGCLITTP